MNTYLTSNRTLGQFPLSIATSLAIEAAFGIYPDRPETKEPILKYNTLWINIRTLFRNILGAMEKGDAGRVQPPMLAITLSEEMTFIRDIIKEGTNNSVNVVFYYSNYSNIETHFKHSVIRMDNTDKQKEYDVRGAKFLIRQRRDAFAQQDIIEMSLADESPIFPTLAYTPINNTEAKLLNYRLRSDFASKLYRAVD